MMNDLFDKLFSLGIGIAAASKEQVEKLVNELVEKGKMTRSESAEVVESLINKGKETQKKMEEVVNSKVEETLKSLNLVTKKDFDELEARVKALEEKLRGEGTDKNDYMI
mgnify:CR=1 FL=1